MNKIKFILTLFAFSVLIFALLYCVELLMPMSSLVMYIVVLHLILIWLLITVLRDDGVPTVSEEHLEEFDE